jgi:hypothetical protein
MSELPDIQCPKCGAFNQQPASICTCGYSYYPREALKPPGPKTPESAQANCATGGMAIGFCSLFMAVYGPGGLLLIAVGLVLSFVGLSSERRGRARIGLVCNVIGLAITAFVVVVFRDSFFRGWH